MLIKSSYQVYGWCCSIVSWRLQVFIWNTVFRYGRKNMISYLHQLRSDKLLLWFYLVWYLTISVIYFDSDPMIWGTAVGIALIVGFALLLNVSGWPVNFHKLDRWQVLRFFLIPFCVSSYSLLIRDKGCVLIFPPDLNTNAIALSVIAGFLTIVLLAKKYCKRHACAKFL